jgi:hypothetical protein
MNFVFVYPESDDTRFSRENRCLAPARVINRTGRYQAKLISWTDFLLNSNETQQIIDASDFIILHRGLWSAILPRIQHWKARDKKIIADFVDAYQIMDSEELADIFDLETSGVQGSAEFSGAGTPLLTQIKWTLQSVNGATTPSQRLSDDWSPYTRTGVVPDFVDMDQLGLITPVSHDTINIGWRGSIRQYQALKTGGIMMALEAACQMRKNIKLLFALDHPEAVGPTSIPADQIYFSGWNQNGGWNHILEQTDIGIFPMIGEAGKRASNLQLLEFMALKIPWIASQNASVYDLQNFGWIAENSAEHWLKAIIEISDHLSEFRAEAETSPYLFAISKSLEENIQMVADTYVRLATTPITRPLTIPPPTTRSL